MLRYLAATMGSPDEQRRKATWLRRLLGIFLFLAVFTTLLGLLQYGLNSRRIELNFVFECNLSILIIEPTHPQ